MKTDEAVLLGLGALALLALSAGGTRDAAPAGDEPITDPARIAAVQDALLSLGYHPGFGRGQVSLPTLAALSQFLTDRAGARMEAAVIDPYFERLVLEAAAERDTVDSRPPRPEEIAVSEPAPPAPPAPPVAAAPPAPVGPIMDPYGGAVVPDGARIRAVQTALVSMGFDTRGIDGRVGTNTLRAVNEWIAARGAPGSGSVRRITTPLALAILADDESGYRRPAPLGDVTTDRALRVARVASALTRRRY